MRKADVRGIYATYNKIEGGFLMELLRDMICFYFEKKRENGVFDMHFCSVFYDLWYRYSCFKRTWWEAWIMTRKVIVKCGYRKTNVRGMSPSVHVGQTLHLVIVHYILTISQTKF